MAEKIVCKNLDDFIERCCQYFKANYLYVTGHESFIRDFKTFTGNLSITGKKWSDYDECMFQNIIMDENCPLDSDQIEWLKSLKNMLS